MGTSDQLALELGTAYSSLSDSTSQVTNATSSLLTAATTFNDVAAKIEARLKDLATWEANLIAMKKANEECSAALDKREEDLKRETKEKEEKLRRDTVEQEERFSRRESELLILEMKLKEWEVKKEALDQLMERNAAKVGEAVTLSIGGKKFVTTKQILSKYEDSYFTEMFKRDVKLEGNKFFIDRDPKYFSLLMSYLREGKITEVVKAREVEGVLKEFAYYRIPVPEFEREELPVPSPIETSASPVSMFDTKGTLLSAGMKSTIESWLPDNYFFLRYKATRDGFAPDVYHDYCDAMGPYLVVIMSTEGYLFGGYIQTTISHDSPTHTEKHSLHSSSFLYSLTNPFAIAPTSYPLLPGNWAMNYTPHSHIHLGWGRWFSYDLELSATPNVDTKSYCNFPFAFSDTTGKGKLTFTNSEYFRVSDIEVYAVVMDRKFSSPTTAEPLNGIAPRTPTKTN